MTPTGGRKAPTFLVIATWLDEDGEITTNRLGVKDNMAKAKTVAQSWVDEWEPEEGDLKWQGRTIPTADGLTTNGTSWQIQIWEAN